MSSHYETTLLYPLLIKGFPMVWRAWWRAPCLGDFNVMNKTYKMNKQPSLIYRYLFLIEFFSYKNQVFCWVFYTWKNPYDTSFLGMMHVSWTWMIFVCIWVWIWLKEPKIMSDIDENCDFFFWQFKIMLIIPSCAKWFIWMLRNSN